MSKMEISCIPSSKFACGLKRKTFKKKLSPISAYLSAQYLEAPDMKPKIMKEGWIRKRGQYIKTWRRRYFVLRDDGLLLGFKTRPEFAKYSDPSNIFTVKGCQVMYQERPRQFTFILRGLREDLPIERTFSVDSDVERAKWVQAIQFVDRNLDRDAQFPEGVPSSEHNGLRDSSCTKRTRNISLEEFELIRTLGRGSFGKVVLGRERSSDQLFAIKIVKKEITNTRVSQALTESRTLRITNHPFLIALKYSFQTDDRFFFVMEYLNGGELFFHLMRERVFSEDKARFYGAEILLALEYLHELGIVYRDLKLENLLLDRNGHVKIVDFGSCKEGMTYGKTTGTFCGTPEYLAPEILEGIPYGRAADWWSFGAVLYEMICGRFPFRSSNSELLFDMIINEEVKFPPSLSCNAKSLLRGLLTKDPKMRLGGGERDAKDIREHAFFCRIQWKKLLAKEIAPPFTPQVASDLDVRYFDPEFTEESADLTPPASLNSTSADPELPYFQEFSYHGTDTKPGRKLI